MFLRVCTSTQLEQLQPVSRRLDLTEPFGWELGKGKRMHAMHIRSEVTINQTFGTSALNMIIPLLCFFFLLHFFKTKMSLATVYLLFFFASLQSHRLLLLHGRTSLAYGSAHAG